MTYNECFKCTECLVYQVATQVINLETNYINISEQTDLYVHQNTSICVFCTYICIQYMHK